VDLVIVDEFGYGQPFIPIILALVHKDPQELLHLLVDPFHLATSLWMVGRRCCDLDSQELAEATDEIQHKLIQLQLYSRG